MSKELCYECENTNYCVENNGCCIEAEKKVCEAEFTLDGIKEGIY